MMKSVTGPLARRAAVGLLSSVLALGAGAALGQTPAAAPLTTRIETEYKLAVPVGQAGAVWRWLSTRYALDKPRQLGKGWETAQGEETFEDRYFDDARRSLMQARAGMRHRRRFDTRGELTKQLVQLKLTDDAAGLMREEWKFKPVATATATSPLADLLRPADHHCLDSALAPLHLRVADLAPSLTLGQRRRRLYLHLDGGDYATLTLDSSYHLGGRAVTFTEVEVELNEKRFTGASEAERRQMQVVMQGLRADLLHQFPGLTQDQRPKYNKLAALLDAAPAKRGGAVGVGSANPPGGRPSIWLAGALLGLLSLGLLPRWLGVRRRA